MIHPLLQKWNLDGEKISADSFTLRGDFTEYAISFFKKNGLKLSDNGFPIEISLTESDSMKDCREKYELLFQKEFIRIKAFSKRGLFYALNTFLKLVSSVQLREGVIEDYPMFLKRGYIEGFYGPVWSAEKRRSVMELMAKNGMNTYFYAPKDDLYHREKWREKYPENELSALIDLFALAHENEMDFYWCVGPGLSYQYSAGKDFFDLTEKIKSIYAIGVKNFGLLLDDIPFELRYEEDRKKYGDTVNAQIGLVNKLYDFLKTLSEKNTLTVCPTQYCGDESSGYITAFGRGIPPEVGLFWTGEEICSRVLRTREAEAFFASTGHRPLYWDNYPVNDCEMFQEMHLGAIEGRDKDLYRHCEGFISNVMEYAECSKIPLLTVADYLWNPICYEKEASLKNAEETVLGRNAELFSYFSDHLHVSCLSKNGSATMSGVLSDVAFLFSEGRNAEALFKLKEYIEKMNECDRMLADESVPLFSELSKWRVKFHKCCVLLELICDCIECPDELHKSALEHELNAYNADAVLLTGFCLREAAEKTLEL